MEHINMTVLYGVKVLEPITYIVRKRIQKRRFWFDKVDYYVETKYIKMYGFDSVKDACEVMLMAGIRPKIHEECFK